MQTEHGRDAHAAGQDRRVRSGTADVGDKGREVLILEGHDIGGRKVVGDDNQVFALDPFAEFADGMIRMTGKLAHNALDNLAHVVAAFAQIHVVDFFELGDENFHLLHNRPFRVTAPVADDLLGRFRQLGVGEDHQMQVDEGTDVGRRMLHADFHRRKLAANPGQRRLETCDFLFHHAWRDDQVRYLECRLRNEVGLANGNAAGDSEAVQSETHGVLIPLRRICRRSV